MAEKQSLIFIPDISGFTSFVQKTEVEHSSHIIAELLEVLIDANELEMTLAEIEGDALFFYLHDNIPSRELILRQIEKMFIRFHSHLLAYKYKRICQCGACTSAEQLKLKFVLHSGNIDFIKVKDFQKPFGENVIIAHRLLKNNIEAEEYALMSADLISSTISEQELELKIGNNGVTGEAEYDLGKVEYQYYALDSLMDHLDANIETEPGEKIEHPWKYETLVDTSIGELYDIVTNFERRLEWSDGVSEIKYEKERVNNVGTTHECVVKDKLISFETITSDFGGRLVYGEKTSDVPIVDSMNTYFIFEPVDEDHTRLKVEVHPYTRSAFKKLLIPFLKRLVWNNFKTVYRRIKPVAEGNG